MIRSLIQTPDWRWRAAIDGAQYTRVQATYQLKGADELVRAASSFKRAADARLDTDAWPLVGDAYELYTSHARTRLMVECLLLGVAETAMIAKLTGLPSAVVEHYHDLFFDVRGRPQLWVNAELFQGRFLGDLDERDQIGIQHRLAYLLGWEAFVDSQSGMPTNASRAKMITATRDILIQQLLNTALVHGGNPDVLARLAAASAGAQSTKQATPVTEADESYGAAVLGFLRSVPLQVADPDDPALRNPSAREPRAHISLRDALDAVDDHDR